MEFIFICCFFSQAKIKAIRIYRNKRKKKKNIEWKEGKEWTKKQAREKLVSVTLVLGLKIGEFSVKAYLLQVTKAVSECQNIASVFIHVMFPNVTNLLRWI